MSTVFHYSVLIKEGHLDTFGHVNNAIYLSLFEEARWDLVTKHGYGMQKIMETGLAPTILEINIRFLKEIRLREEIIIQTQLLSFTGKTGKVLQTMMRDAEECCTAVFTVGIFSLKDRKMVIPSIDWLAALGYDVSKGQ